MPLKLTPKSDQTVLIYLDEPADIATEQNAGILDCTITANTGASAKLKWTESGFVWSDIKGFDRCERLEGQSEEYDSLIIDADVQFIHIQGPTGVQRFITQNVEVKLKTLIEEIKADVKDESDLISFAVRWLFVNSEMFIY